VFEANIRMLFACLVYGNGQRFDQNDQQSEDTC